MLSRSLSHVHIHYATTVGLLAGRIFPITVSSSIHGSGEFVDPAGFYIPQKIAASLFIRAISQYGRSQLMKVSPYTQWQKLEVSRLGVDSALYQPRPFRESPEPFTLLAVGRLVPEKGLHILLAALQQLIRENRSVQLRIAGDGPERAGLEQHIAAAGLTRHVALEGWLNRDQVHALYRQTDIYALSSFLEGIPVVLMEAMVMEIPCIASRITGIPELIQDGIDGLLVTPSDAPELAAAIARLMDDPVLRRRLGEAARRRILADYDLARNTAAFARILERRLTDQLRSSP
jgi:glycosyltransferase involved in cell wall biosynthesis